MVPNEKFVEMDVPVPLTKEEAEKLMVELAGVDRDQILLEEEAKTEAKAYKERINTKKKRRVELLGIIHDKVRKERRQVRITYDFTAGIKYYWSPFQPGVLLKEEPITDDERAELMFKLGPAPEGAENANDGAETPIVVTDAELVEAIDAVGCHRCGVVVAMSEATKVEVRDEKSGELLGTEFECSKCHGKPEAAETQAEFAAQVRADEAPPESDENEETPE